MCSPIDDDLVNLTPDGGEELPGVVAMPPAKLLPESANTSDVLEIQYLLVDTGLTPREVERKVKVGDLVSFGNEPMDLAGNVISGHTLDNRSSVAALTICLEELQGKSHVWDVWAVATVQEETSYLGGYTSAFEIRPQIAIAVDVAAGDEPHGLRQIFRHRAERKNPRAWLEAKFVSRVR